MRPRPVSPSWQRIKRRRLPRNARVPPCICRSARFGSAPTRSACAVNWQRSNCREACTSAKAWPTGNASTGCVSDRCRRSNPPTKWHRFWPTRVSHHPASSLTRRLPRRSRLPRSARCVGPLPHFVSSPPVPEWITHPGTVDESPPTRRRAGPVLKIGFRAATIRRLIRQQVCS